MQATEFKDLLPLISDKKTIFQKKGQKSNEKKKEDIIDKEVFQFTQGLFPIQPASSTIIDKQSVKTKWVQAPVQYQNGKVTNIKYWVQDQNKDKYFPYEKFQIRIELIKFSDQEYNEFIQNIDSDWSLEETRYLWQLCEQFDLRWQIIYDRYDEKYNRSIEDIKNRYYTVAKKLIENDKNKRPQDQKWNKYHNLMNYQYDPYYEKVRKFQLEKFLKRTNVINEEEKKLMDELKKIEQIIKKDEKEQNNLQQVLGLYQKQDQENKHEDDIDEQTLHNVNEVNEKKIQQKQQQQERLNYLRGKMMNEPLPISSKIQKRLNLVLTELNILTRPTPTEDNEKLFDDLREKILVMFSLQKHEKKKLLEKKLLEEKLVDNFQRFDNNNNFKEEMSMDMRMQQQQSYQFQPPQQQMQPVLEKRPNPYQNMNKSQGQQQKKVKGEDQ